MGLTPDTCGNLPPPLLGIRWFIGSRENDAMPALPEKLAAFESPTPVARYET